MHRFQEKPLSRSFTRDEAIGLINAAAQAVNAVTRIPPLMTREERDTLNALFDVPSESDAFTGNIARFPDEIAAVLMNTAGGHLYSIGILLASPSPGIAPVAALTRVSIEAAADAMWIMSPENSSERVKRTVQLNYSKLRSLSEKEVSQTHIGRWKSQMKRMMTNPRSTDEKWVVIGRLHRECLSDQGE